MIKPHITEKSLKLAQVHQYTFELKGTKVNKPSFAKIIKNQFKVTPTQVRMLKKLGKRFAVVKLRANEKIEGFEVKTDKK